METHTHICPLWVGKLLLLPVRKLFNNPEKILGPHVKPGMKVVDFGCALGYFTLPMARKVGTTGAVYAVDIQKNMIDSLSRRISKAHLDHIIHPVLITEKTDFAELAGKIDFVLLFYMVHEVPDQTALMHTVSKMLKPGGKALVVEPKGHVTAADFKSTVDIAGTSGLKPISDLPISGSLEVLLEKQA